MSLSKKSHLSACLEAVPGTLATAPQLYVPCKSNFKAKVKRVYPPEERGTRDGNYVVQNTTQHDDIDIKGAWYNDSFALFLLAFMGTDTVTQPDATHVPTAYKHSLTLADTPPAFSLWKSYDVQAYSATYGAVSKLGFKVGADGKLLDADVSVMSNRHVNFGGSLTPTYSTLLPFQGYKPVIQINGVTSLDLEDLDITLETKLNPWYALGGGADYQKMYYGERTVKVDFTARFDANTLYANYQNGTDIHLNMDVQGALIGSYLSNNYFQELQLDFPIVGFDEVEHDLSKEIVTIKAKMTARPGATANSLFSGFVQNTVSAYTPA